MALMAQFRVIHPDGEVVATALRGTAMCGLSWLDAHPWAYAEVHGLAGILSEDLEHGRHHGAARVVDPFLAAADGVHEPPPLHTT